MTESHPNGRSQSECSPRSFAELFERLFLDGKDVWLDPIQGVRASAIDEDVID